MNRYLAVAWNPDAPDEATFVQSVRRRIRRDPRWAVVISGPGFDVFLSGRPTSAFRVYALKGHGVVLGNLAAEASTPKAGFRSALSETEAAQIARTAGQHLADNFWGRYVLLLKAAPDAGLTIFRDPTGALPCFVLTCNGVAFACSHIKDCDELGAISAEIDWDHVAAYLRFDHMVTAHTGLVGVRQVQAGERMTVLAGRVSASYCWSPDRIYAAATIDDHNAAMQQLRDSIKNCVAAWASCYGTILHELSGGLDSAVVLAALALSPRAPKVVCENHYTSDAEADERFFARRAAEAAGVELIETAIPTVDWTLEGMLEPSRVASPTQVPFVPAIQARRMEILKDYEIDVVFSGQGGDHFFQSIPFSEIAAEFFTRHGMNRQLLDVVDDTARFTRKSYWSVFGTVIASGLLGRRADPYDCLEPSPILADELRNERISRLIRHPWVDSAADLPNCKRRQVFDIVDAQNFYRLPEQCADIIHPLISQPIIELCLQIPSYRLAYGGRDRALVRDAFAGIVPDEILKRRVKGATTGYFNNLLIRNITFLREYLLDGLLADRGLIDRDRTSATLTEAALTRGETLLFPILDVLRAEFWLRLWRPGGSSAAM